MCMLHKVVKLSDGKTPYMDHIVHISSVLKNPGRQAGISKHCLSQCVLSGLYQLIISRHAKPGS